MGPKARYLGPEVPQEDLIWQDPLPGRTPAVNDGEIAELKAQDPRQRVFESASWSRLRGRRRRHIAGRTTAAAPMARAFASVRRRTGRSTILRSCRGSGKARDIRSASQVLSVWPTRSCSAAGGGREGGERRRLRRRPSPSPPAAATRPRSRPTPTASSRSSPRPTVSATICRRGYNVPTEELLLDRAQLLGLTAPEMTVLVGGLRVLGANTGGSSTACSRSAGQLTNDFFVNLLDMGTAWKQVDDAATRRSSAPTARPTSRSGPPPAPTWCSAPTRSFARCPRSMRWPTPARSSSSDFVAAWTKVMNADRFDLRRRRLATRQYGILEPAE